jgi:hypothetical protein
LKQIVKLLEQKEALQAQVNKIDQQLAAYESGSAAGAGRAAARPAPKAGQRRRLKDEIIDLLKEAGKNGATIRELGERLNLKGNRLYAWFYSTGNKLQQIKKIGPAQYRWTG